MSRESGSSAQPLSAASAQQQSDRRPDRPFALRSTLYTAGFLVFILGAVPSVFFLLGEIAVSPGASVGDRIAEFWIAFRRLSGMAIFTIGLAAYLFCSIWLIFFGRGPHVEFDPPKVFVATGPYRWVRNPVVITLLATVLGEAVYLGSVGILVLFLAGLPVAHLQVTRLEEPLLRERFGESYVQYCRRVPRWIPKPPTE